MKKLFILASFAVTALLQAQTNRFVYELKYRNSPDEDYRKEMMNLDITQKSVTFYDAKFAEYDSINKQAQSSVSRYSTKIDQVLERKLNSFKNNWYRDFFDYFVVKSNDEMTWKLFDETQDYNGYKLQKATTNFGGRKWTAWFSKETQINEGPYKFRGLPGLIFIIEDDEKNFVYHLISNKKIAEDYDTKDFVETHYGKVALKVTNKQFNKYLEDIYADPLRMFSQGIKDGKTSNFKNETVSTIEELNSKKQMLKNGIKSRYIFIEKDKQPILK